MKWADLTREQQRDMLEAFATPRVVEDLMAVLTLERGAVAFPFLAFDRFTFAEQRGGTPLAGAALLHIQAKAMTGPKYTPTFEIALTDYGAGMLKTLRETTRG